MKNLTIKNSTLQFLAFVSEQGGNTVDIAFQNGAIEGKTQTQEVKFYNLRDCQYINIAFEHNVF